MRRILSLVRRARRKSPRHLAQLLVARAGRAVDVAALDFPLRDGDIFDSQRAQALRTPAPGTPVTRVAWIVVPPGPGSGGHTTLFRMLQHAARAGIANTIFFYDRYDGDFQVNVARLREGWPWLEADVRPLPDRLEGFDAYVASSWQTAHVLGQRTLDTVARRLYFIQDYEPYFTGRGSVSALAEDTYRFGFENIALGSMVHATLQRELGVDSRVVPFGQDADTYALDDAEPPREGVAFFAKTGNERRGYRLSILALREFQRRFPEQTVHVYGDAVREPGLRVVNHGYLPPTALNGLYNRVRAGLVLSFTNISLIPAELAAAGAVPVMNDDAAGRLVFDNPEAVWAPATPTGLADALGRVVTAADTRARARAVASWRGASWDDTGDAVVGVLQGVRVGEES